MEQKKLTGIAYSRYCITIYPPNEPKKSFNNVLLVESSKDYVLFNDGRRVYVFSGCYFAQEIN